MNALCRSLLAAALALAAAVSRAESDTSEPLALLDSTDPGSLAIDVQANHYWRLLITRSLRDPTHELSRERVELPMDRAVPAGDGRVQLDFALDRDELAHVPDGVYVQRIAVDAIPLAATDRIYRTQRSVYFRVTAGAVERIGMREYSEAAEPTHLERDASGRMQRVNAGGAVATPEAERNGAARETALVQIESADEPALRAGTAAVRAADESGRE
jgi:hypothetical protein